MSRPWMWALTEAGALHATTVTGCVVGVAVDTVCGDVVIVVAELVEVCGGDPCLCCVQLLPCGIGRVW